MCLYTLQYLLAGSFGVYARDKSFCKVRVSFGLCQHKYIDMSLNLVVEILEFHEHVAALNVCYTRCVCHERRTVRCDTLSFKDLCSVGNLPDGISCVSKTLCSVRDLPLQDLPTVGRTNQFTNLRRGRLQVLMILTDKPECRTLSRRQYHN